MTELAQQNGNAVLTGTERAEVERQRVHAARQWDSKLQSHLAAMEQELRRLHETSSAA